MGCPSERIAENLAVVRQRMAAAAQRSGRPPEAVRLIAVTKYVDLEATAALLAAGCRDLGESRPQSLWDKAAALPAADVRWHMIGHLQRNKARRTLPLLTLLHSADSVDLLQTLDRLAAEEGRRVAVLLEVNVSGDAAKHGFTAAQLPDVVARLPHWPQIETRGLMGMAGLESDADQSRREFAALRQLREQLRRELPAGVALDELSMGMSGDYESAIEEGATLVRIGSALFEGLES